MFLKTRTQVLLLAAVAIAQPLAGQERTAEAIQRVSVEEETDLLDRPARLMVERVPLSTALTQIGYATGIGFAFSPSLIPDDKLVDCDCWSATIRESLGVLLRGTGLRYVVLGDQIVVEEARRPLRFPAQATLATLSWSSAPATQVGESVRLSAPPPLRQGTITGRVIDRGSTRPLSGAQVSISELQMGTITSSDGSYVLEEVPAGTHTISVRYIGYGEAQQQVVVQEGQTVTANFELASRAVDLDELVVTGVGVVTERRRLGATLNSIRAEDIQEAPVENVSDILRGRVPGLVAAASGETGAASPIRIRGTASISQRNDPLIYVDGVRIDNTMSQAASVSTQTLDQLNPSDIERVEILSGAAAATLYGTEASSGVIQIFTRRGREGPPQFTLAMDQGISRLPLSRIPHNVVYDRETDRLWRNAPAEDFARTGHRQSYDLSVTGGAPTVQYFASLRFMDETGSLPVGEQKNMALRSRLNFDLSPKLDTELGVNVIRNELEAPYPTWGIIGEFILADPRRVSEAAPYGEMFHTVDGAMAYRHNQTTNHLTVHGQADYRWTESILSSATIGYNDITTGLVRFAPYGESPRAAPFGERELQDSNRSLFTIDLKTSWETEFVGVSSSFVGGGQYFLENSRNQRLGARDFAGPGLGTIRGASTVFAVDEAEEQVINAGFFLQEQLGFRDRLFLTGGVRVDGNSAFGEDFGLQVYPKAGLSYVVSDAPFWNFGAWDLFRVRLAYGASGLQPAAFAAQRMWEAVSVAGNQPGVIPGNLGNPDLKPEVSIEREVGAEVGFFDGRLGLELTYFNQKTEDAIIAREFPASAGFLNPQLVNLAKLTSQGIEASLNWSIIDRPDWRWTVNASVATLDQKVADLGDVTPFRVAGGNRFNTVREGYMPGAVIGPTLDPNNPYDLSVPIEEFTDLHAQLFPNILQTTAGQDSLVFLGNPIPTVTGSFSTTVSPHPQLRFQAMFVGGAGLSIYNETEEIRVQSHIDEEVSTLQMELANPSTTPERRREIADRYARRHWAVLGNWVEKADYLRLQEVSATYTTSETFAQRLGLRNLQFTLGGSNLFLWTTYSGIVDPGTTDNPAQRQQPLAQNVDYFNTPIPPRLRFSVRTGW